MSYYQPSHYFAHLIGHEAPGSILSLLRAKGWSLCSSGVRLMSSPCAGWSTTLAAGPVNGARGFWFFKINLTLTEEGQGRRYFCVLVMQ